MQYLKEQVLRKLRPLADSADFSIVQALLVAPDTVAINQPTDGQNASEQFVRPRDIIKTWEARAKNASRKGFRLPGVDRFVEKLKSIPLETALVNVAFRSGPSTGLFWFDKHTEEPIGYVISQEAEVSKGRR